jgi:hypothetical protein
MDPMRTRSGPTKPNLSGETMFRYLAQ